MRRVGLILPSSNVVMEPAVARFGALDVAWHAARITVPRIGVDQASDAQFELKVVEAAADQLGDAEVDAIMFAGTAGAWLGIAHDRELVDAIGTRTGRPVTTAMLAVLDRLHAGRLERIALMTPFTDSVQARIREVFAQAGIDVVADLSLGIESSRDMAEITPETLMTRARALAHVRTDAIVTLCTNMRTHEIDRALADLAGRPVLDSVRVSLEAAAMMARTPAS